MSEFTEALVTIALAIVGLAIVATLVSRKAQTPQVIQAAGSAFGNSLAVAQAPVTGTALSVDLSYPSSGGLFGMGGF